MVAIQLPHGELVPGLYAQVQYDPEVTGPRDLIRAVDDAGFEGSLNTTRCNGL